MREQNQKCPACAGQGEIKSGLETEGLPHRLPPVEVPNPAVVRQLGQSFGESLLGHYLDLTKSNFQKSLLSVFVQQFGSSNQPVPAVVEQIVHLPAVAGVEKAVNQLNQYLFGCFAQSSSALSLEMFAVYALGQAYHKALQNFIEKVSLEQGE